jgi:enterochelin esterase family protein
MIALRLLALALLFAAKAGAQTAPNPPSRPPSSRPIVSPEVQPDHAVTFRLRAPAAAKVELAVVSGATQAMTKDEAGVWSTTLGPLEPDLYRYNFLVDGLRIADPVNPSIDVGRNSATSLVDIPGTPPRFDERRPGPSGTLQIRHYRSAVLGVARRVFIYVPAAYDQEPLRRFPVLYLRHGNGDLEGSWNEIGRAGVILDNLVAAGRAVPMLIVMPNGYPEGVPNANGSPPGFGGEDATSKELLEDLIPLVEQNYRVQSGPEQRAIAGLSMGGGQAIYTGLNHLDRFAWVAEFSSGAVGGKDFDLAKAFPGFLDAPAATNARLRLLFLSCGTDDPRLAGHLRVIETLNQHSIHHEWLTVPGAHEWKVWRRSLAALLPKLFQPAAP